MIKIDNNFKTENFTGAIYFSADWCGPCKVYKPILSELDENIVNADVDDNSELSVIFGIRNIPTLVFIKNGEVISRLVGKRTNEELKKAFDEIK